MAQPRVHNIVGGSVSNQHISQMYCSQQNLTHSSGDSRAARSRVVSNISKLLVKSLIYYNIMNPWHSKLIKFEDLLYSNRTFMFTLIKQSRILQPVNILNINQLSMTLRFGLQCLHINFIYQIYSAIITGVQICLYVVFLVQQLYLHLSLISKSFSSAGDCAPRLLLIQYDETSFKKSWLCFWGFLPKNIIASHSFTTVLVVLVGIASSKISLD